ncbi:MAG: efflux RND transporter periplasmic adaptor subunit [Emticicia sp.]|uniref:efflux RND transporter periplasmic adaptor subunit n=1 Tax=Emticicia sp. TaxID=1930953 RepID=UPI003BA42AE5
MKFYLMPVALLLLACNSEPKEVQKEEAILVKTEQVASTSIQSEIAISGSIEGSTTARLGFMVAGKIKSIHTKEGQNVSKGQLIASLDPSNYVIAKQLSDVQVNATADEYSRLKQLRTRGSVSESDFSKVSFSLEEAQLQQKLQAKNVEDTKLYSPISGVLLSKQTEVGEIVGVGTPLFVLSSIQKVLVSAFIPESELQHIKIGQKAMIYIGALDKTFEGKVSEVGAVADQATRAFTVKITLENKGLHIRPGMIAEVKLNNNQSKESILLPSSCIGNDANSQSYVYVVDKTSGKAFKRNVSLGKIVNNKIEIVAGLSLGETVVTSGQTKLSDGSHIILSK